MKTYQITILTSKGPIKLNYEDSEPLALFEARILKQYGTFVMLQSKEIN